MKLPLVSAKKAAAKGAAKGKGTEPKSEGSKWLGIVIFLLLGAVVMMAIVYSMVAIQAGYDKEYLGLIGEQRVLSQRISKFAGQANRGQPVTFDQLKKYRDEFDNNLRLLRAGDPNGMPPSSDNVVLDKLSTVVRHWKHYNDSVTIIVKARDVVVTLREIVKLINENSPQLLALTDEVATLMAQKGSKADQVYIASRQLMLSQRIINNVNRVLEGGEGAVTAADRFGRDAALYGRVLRGFLNGDKTLKIDRVYDKQVLERIAEASDLFDMIGRQVSGILERSPEMFQVSEAVQNVLNDSDTLLDALSDYEVAYQQEIDNRWFTSMVGNLFAFASVLLLFALGMSLKGEGERRLSQAESQRVTTEEQNRRSQQVIM